MGRTARLPGSVGRVEFLAFIYYYTPNLTPRQKHVLAHMI